MAASAVRNIIVTGSNTGLGFKAVQALCGKGHHVIMAARNPTKAHAAIADLQKSDPKAKVTFMQLDTSSMDSVRKFVETFSESKMPLHSLVNNAGIFNVADQTRHTTSDGLELTFATNHLGSFLLSNLLLPEIKKTAASTGEATIVFTSSGMHDPVFASKGMPFPVNPIDFDDLMLAKEGAYNSVQSYKNSKAANIMTAITLSEQLAGTGVLVNSMDPGLVPDVVANTHKDTAPKEMLQGIIGGFSTTHAECIRTPEQGGAYIAELVEGDKVKGHTGKYFNMGELNKETSPETQDADIRKKMWDASAKLVGM